VFSDRAFKFGDAVGGGHCFEIEITLCPRLHRPSYEQVLQGGGGTNLPS
jgi:hypothetical protein